MLKDCDASLTIDDLVVYSDCLPESRFSELTCQFTLDNFAALFAARFPFYRTTFWYPCNRSPESIFEKTIEDLRPVVCPSEKVIGVEWWFSVLNINTTPRWLLPCHFDRNDLNERDASKLVFPERASVLFLNSVPYGELVVTDQVIDKAGKPMPREPNTMRFITPNPNEYIIFPGQLYHGVIGRMWRSKEPDMIRVAMAVNWWAEMPKANYLRDSKQAVETFGLM